MPKIVPFRKQFDNPHGLLARMLEDPDITGFVGMIFKGAGEERESFIVSVGTNQSEIVFAGAAVVEFGLHPEDA